MKRLRKQNLFALKNEHLSKLQGRLEREEPIGERADPDAPAAIRKRSHKPHPETMPAFSEDGELIEGVNEWTLIDAYLRTSPGSLRAAVAMRKWQRAWGRTTKVTGPPPNSPDFRTRLDGGSG